MKPLVKKQAARATSIEPLGRKTFLACATTAVLASAIIFVLFHLWQTDLRHPLRYPVMGDADGILAFFKSFTETGWYGINCRLGAPGCQYQYDFPIVNSAHAFSVTLLYLLLRNLFLAINLYWFANAVLTAVSAAFVLQIFRVNRVVAIAGGLLYCFSEYWLYRGTAHYTLSMYNLCPFAILFSVFVLNGVSPPFFREDGGVNWKLVAPAAAICFLVGCCDIYYAFFFCVIIGVATVGGALREGGWRTPAVGGVLIGSTAVAVFLNLAPNFWFHIRYGQNPDPVVRDFSNAEVWGMMLIRMLLPAHNHRIRLLSAIRQRYDATTPLVANENDYVSLGVLGSVGLLILFYWLLFAPHERDVLKRSLARLNGALVLIGTVGGFGVVFAFFVSNQIRAYNRLYPFISFMSFTAIALLATDAKKRLNGHRMANGLFYGAVGVIALCALYDQVPRNVLPFDPNTQTLVSFAGRGEALFATHASFIASLDAALPPGAMVFQLPFHSYPESGPVARMGDYDQFRAYILSSRIHWSGGAMRGRWENAWQRQIASLPIERMLQELTLAGFEGIYVDSWGYQDGAASIETTLRNFLGSARVSGDNRFAYYSLSGFAGDMRRTYSAAEWEHARKQLLSMLFIQWKPNFLPIERDRSDFWRWSNGPEGHLAILNRMDMSRTLHMRFKLITGGAEPRAVRMDGSGIHETLMVDSKGAWIERAISVPPGRSEFSFSSRAKPFDAPGDTRTLFFGLEDYSIDEFAPDVASSWAQDVSAKTPVSKASVTAGVLKLNNRGSMPEHVEISAVLAGNALDRSPLEISGRDFQERLTISHQGGPWHKNILVAPGSSEIRFSCECGGTPNGHGSALAVSDLSVTGLDLDASLHELKD